MCRVKILHIHADYPDGRESYPSTMAVKNLLSATPQYTHFVVSINRTSNPFKISRRKFSDGITFVFWALPIPIVYQCCLFLFSLWLRYSLREINFDLAHAHKLSTEGVLAESLCQHKKRPYIVSVRGGSDVRAARRYWDLRKKYRQILKNAQSILWVSPWAQGSLKQYINFSNENQYSFPNICNTTLKTGNQTFDAPIVTVLSFHQYKRKGILQLLEAIQLAHAEGIDISLDIYGTGPKECIREVENQIKKLGLQNKAKLKGQINHSNLIMRMSEYSMLALPAINETFGMVYIEAISQGIPFIAHKNTGVDGYFNNSFAQFASSQDPEHIKTIIYNIRTHYTKIISDLTLYNSQNSLRIFNLNFIVDNYDTIIKKSIKR